MSKQKHVKKPAAVVAPVASAKPAAKAVTKAVKRADVADAIVASLTGKSAPVDDAKAKSARIRAERYPAAAKAEAEKKTAKATGEKKVREPKAVAPVVAFVAKTVPKGGTAHAIALGDRPGNGGKLIAHTHAALHLLGMLKPECPAVPVRGVLAIMGQRAVTYHTGENNFIEKDDMIALTPAGYGKFSSRKPDGALANAYMDLFVTGKVDPILGLSESKVFPVAI